MDNQAKATPIIYYTAINQDGEDVHFEALDDTDARHWAINHLDLSEGWSLFRTQQLNANATK